MTYHTHFNAAKKELEHCTKQLPMDVAQLARLLCCDPRAKTIGCFGTLVDADLVMRTRLDAMAKQIGYDSSVAMLNDLYRGKNEWSSITPRSVAA
jgi:hypothetical protein